jgi:Family of unknown function (DUF5703)
MPEFSYRVVYLPRSTSRDAARRILTDHAEHGDWELARLRLYADGSRKVTLRRQIIRAVRTRDVHVRQIGKRAADVRPEPDVRPKPGQQG